jgi:hypothetical protein
MADSSAPDIGQGAVKSNQATVKIRPGHRRLSRPAHLVLLPAKSNAALGNTDFRAKAAVFSNAPDELTRHVASADDWTPEAIARRQRTLAELALRTRASEVRA